MNQQMQMKPVTKYLLSEKADQKNTFKITKSIKIKNVATPYKLITF